MKIVKPKRVLEYIEQYGRPASGLMFWLGVTKKALWKNFNELRGSFNSADLVSVGSGKKVVVFNVGGNKFRLICAVHFDRGKVYVLRFMTHAEYDGGKWKKEL